MRALVYLLGSMTVVLILMMTLLRGPASLAMMAFIIPFVAFFAMQVKDIRHDMMVERLVDGSET